MPFAREDLDSNLVSIGEELMVDGGREPQLQVWLTPVKYVSGRPRIGFSMRCHEVCSPDSAIRESPPTFTPLRTAGHFP